jgi:glycosyltransferase involved in cell wall biosynthesis
MRLSIITVNLNNKSGLERTLKSVFEQTNRDFELIVIDGLSTDGSRETITAHQNQINKWVSNKDSGIYNAMNKGVRMAEGEYILFLNSGDCLYSSEILNMISKHSLSEDFVVFDVEMVKKGRREVCGLDKSPREILITGAICHQAVFHHRRVFQKLGLYDESFQFTADYEFFLRAFFKARCTWKSFHDILAVYDNIHGVTSNVQNAKLCHDERRRAQKNVFDPETVNVLEEQHREIESLSRFKSMYEGLMNSHSVRLALWTSSVTRRFTKSAAPKTPI